MLFPETRTILIFCEESGVFANLYRSAGYNVVVRDLKINPDHDVRFEPYIETGGVYGFLGFPPCTHLAGSGARWWKGKGPGALAEALAIADACLRIIALYQPKFWVIENPVGRLSQFYGPPKMTFHPAEYAGWADVPGDEAYTKRTCLWGSFTVPRKKPEEPVLGSLMHKLPPSDNRAELRSKTPIGFARAFFAYNN